MKKQFHHINATQLGEDCRRKEKERELFSECIGATGAWQRAACREERFLPEILPYLEEDEIEAEFCKKKCGTLDVVRVGAAIQEP